MSIWQKNDFCKFCFSLKQYCITKPFPCAALFAACVLWLSTPLIIEYLSRPPIVYRDIEQPYPLRVKAGGKLPITRSYDVEREVPVTITRRIEQGDCTKRCERVDLASSEITNGETEGAIISRREIQIPDYTLPGVWVFRAYVNWTDVLGNKRTMAVPPVEFEVIP